MNERLREFGSSFVAGGVSGSLVKTLTAPIERVKIILQTQHVNEQLKSASSKYRGPLDCIRRIYLEEGPFSFWRGNTANVLRYFPSQALNFAFKDTYQELLISAAPPSSGLYVSMTLNLLAAGLAGGTALFVTYPLEMARTRLATDMGGKKSDPSHVNNVKRRYNGIVDCLVKIYRQNGLTGVYKGFVVSLLGVVLFRSLFMGGYDNAKLLLKLDNKQV